MPSVIPAARLPPLGMLLCCLAVRLAAGADVGPESEAGRIPGIAIELGAYGQGRARQLAVDSSGNACIALSDGRLAVHDGIDWHEVEMPGPPSALDLRIGIDGQLHVSDGRSVARLERQPGGRWFMGPWAPESAVAQAGDSALSNKTEPPAKTATKPAGTGEISDILPLAHTADGGMLVLLNRRRQVAILGPDGGFRASIEPEPDGLANMVQAACVDAKGRLWVLTRDRLHRFEPDSPATMFVGRDRPGHGVVRSLVRHQGRLLAATSDGVYRLEPARGGRPARFALVEGMAGVYWCLQSMDDGLLLAGSSRGFERWSEHTQARGGPPPGDVFALAVARNHPRLVFVGTQNAVSALRLDAEKTELLENRPLAVSALSSLIEPEPGILWGASANGEVVRLTLRDSPEHTTQAGAARRAPKADTTAGSGGRLPLIRLSPIVRQKDSPLIGALLRYYGPAEGLPRDFEPLRLLAGGQELLLASAQGLLVFDRVRDRFEPRFTPAPADRLVCAGEGLDGTWLVVRQDGLLRLGRLAPGRPDPVWLDPPPALLASVGQITAVLEEKFDGAHVLWLGGTGGLVRLALDQAWPATTPPVVQVRPMAEPGVFRVAVPFAPPFRSWRIMTRLRGHSEWSAAAADGLRLHPGLSPGSYVFEARAVDEYGHAGAVTETAFAITPPWWRSTGVLLAASLAGALGVVGLIRFRLRRLRRANENLEAVVRQRTIELQNHEAQLRVAKDEAEAASRAKSVFLASMSHELRTPLNAVLGYTQVMLRDDALPGEHRRRLNAIAQGGEHLLRMINEILDLSKIEAGKIELQPRALSFPRLLAAVSEMFQMRASQQGVAFSLRQTTPLPEAVLADEGRLRQVLINLLDNAMKFTPAGGRVELEIGREGERIRFAVRDTGIGIAPNQLGRIFLPFQQASDPALRQQGAGLGLAISQRLVGLMGGVIRVESAPGRGSLFSFAIALPEAAPGEASGAARTRRTGYRGPRRHVLVVDDEETNRRVLCDMLAPLDFRVSEAEDGHAAVDAVRARVPDLILMDLRMPGLDGLGAIREIRRLPDASKTHIVGVSASVFSSDHASAIAHGCEDFLPKPFRESQLLDMVGRLLQLDWIEETAPEEPAADSGDPAAGGDRLPRAELEQLAALAGDGNVTALRRYLAGLRERHPRCGRWLGRLDALAASFQMTRLSHEIVRALDENAAAG